MKGTPLDFRLKMLVSSEIALQSFLSILPRSVNCSNEFDFTTFKINVLVRKSLQRPWLLEGRLILEMSVRRGGWKQKESGGRGEEGSTG